MSQARVTGLWIYPVKSCRGIALQEMQIGPSGPLHDREWMVVDDQNKFITLRSHPLLAQIQTSIQGPFLHLYLGGNKILVDHTQQFEQIETVTVWKDSFKAGIATHDINEAISDFLSQSVKLVRYQSESFRDIKEASTNAIKQTMFSDSRPILLANTATLTELNRQLTEKGEAPSVLERFRANIIIEGLDAFAEDRIDEITIGEVKLRNPKLCVRCVVITQDEKTGQVVSKETLKTLSQIHKEKGQTKVTFGINLTPENLGTIHLDDSVTIQFA